MEGHHGQGLRVMTLQLVDLTFLLGAVLRSGRAVPSLTRRTTATVPLKRHTPATALPLVVATPPLPLGNNGVVKLDIVKPAVTTSSPQITPLAMLNTTKTSTLNKPVLRPIDAISRSNTRSINLLPRLLQLSHPAQKHSSRFRFRTFCSALTALQSSIKLTSLHPIARVCIRL